MAVNLVKEKYSSKVGELVLGATKEEGGTRSHTVTVGGDATLPFLHFEGEVKNRPIVALEVQDIVPAWNDVLKKPFEGVMDKPGDWAKKCVEYGADVIYLKLDGAHPDRGDKSKEDCVAVVKEVLEAVGVPLIVVGCGVEEKDNDVLTAIAEATTGENLLIGLAEEENYKSLTAACMVHKHSIIARSPLDINICKQLNILINEMNLPLNRIAIDPMIGGLGYGIEYAYSIMERARLGSLQNDKMLAMPMICTVGYEAWRAKEANASEEEFPQWGDLETRGIAWEAMTAASLLQAGASILLLRHPESLAKVKKNIDELMNK
ncbi:acetyl-CoA decarbonylase/synthase complex subunit delta [Desulfitispora alkaliphila]|uniref:acetyl-CoA decarbonylase/synthase complex subunit delta n=1 Tax=Desulfitispora alkaliphila TaxID=622674 RepID=UPI003D22D90C